MRNIIKKALSILLAVTIIFSSAYVGLGELDFSGIFAVRAEATSENDIVEFNGHVYQIFDIAMTWTEAQKKCEKMGGYLATITSQEEQNFITNMLSNREQNCYWLGATDKKTEGVWEWVTEEPFEYTNWKSGEPNNETETEHYLEIFAKTYYEVEVGQWNDIEVDGRDGSKSRPFYSSSSIGYICEWDGISQIKADISVLSYEKLKVISSAEASFVNSTLNVSAENYYTVNIPDCTLKSSTKIKVGVVPKSTGSNITAVHCNGYDALVDADKVKFPITGSDDDNEKEIVINVYSSLESPKEYQLLQSGAVIQTSTSGEFNIIAESIPQGSSLSVRVVDSDGTKYKVIKTNIKTYESPTYFEADGNSFSYTFPDDIPILGEMLGGTTFDLDLEELPAFIVCSDDSFKIGLGASVDSKYLENGQLSPESGKPIRKWETENSELWGDWKKLVSDTKKNYLDAKRSGQVSNALYQIKFKRFFSESGFVPKGSATLCAYAEFKKVDGQWMPVSCDGFFAAQIGISNEWQTFVMSVPVVVKLSGHLGINVDFEIGFDFNKMNWYTNCDLSFSLPKIRGSAGIGVSRIFDGSVYVDLENKINIAFTKKYTSCVLSGDLGVSGKFFCLNSDKKLYSFLDWQYYYNNWSESTTLVSSAETYLNSACTGNLLDSSKYKMESREHLKTQSEWYGEYSINTFSLDESTKYTEKLLQESVYDSAEPRIITNNNGETVMIWIADIPERTTGNHSALVYSIYDGDTDTWSVPVIVDDDGTLDSSPDIATDGEEIYVSWVDTKDVFDENVTMKEIAQSSEICVARFNSETGKFESSFNVTNDDFYNGLPSVCVVDGIVYIGYVELTGDDVLLQNGTNYIWLAEGNGENGYNTSSIYETTTAICDVAIGVVGEEIEVAAIIDIDSDLNTIDDVELFITDSDKQLSQLTENTIAEQNIQFAKVNGKNVLAYYADNNINYTSDLIQFDSVSVGGETMISPEYKFIDDSDGTIVFTKCVGGNEECSNIYAIPSIDGVWSVPVKVTDFNADVKSFDLYLNSDSNVGVSYTKVTVEEESLVEEEEGYFTGTFNEKVDIYSTSFNRYNDIELQSVYIDDSLVVSNSEIPVRLSILNNGLSNVNNITLDVNYDSSTVCTKNISDISIAPGEIFEIETSIQLGEITDVVDYDFVISCDEPTDVNNENNVQTVDIGYVNLSLYADRIVSVGSTSAIISIKNNAGIETSATLNIRKDTYDGEIVKSMPIDNIGAYEELTFQIEKDFIATNFDYGDIICFEIVSDKVEKITDDNTQYTSIATPEIDEFDYEILENNCISIINYNWDKTDIVIPETYDDYTVTHISDKAIPSNAKSVLIPSTVINVSTSAFDLATELTSISVSEGNTVYSDVDGILYNADKTTVVRVPIAYETPIVSETATTIGQYAFSKCESKNVVISDSIKLIENNAFYSSAITEITIPEGVTEIKKNAFAECTDLQKFNYNAVNCTVPSGIWAMLGTNSLFTNCTTLTEVVIGSSVEIIPSYIFLGRGSITDVIFEEDSKLKTIKTSAFRKCTNLQQINIPQNVTDIASDAFRGCVLLEAFYVDEENSTYSSQDGILFNKEKTMLIQCPEGFLLNNYTIPDSVTQLASYAFGYCDNLYSVTIPSSISYINENAFRYCDNLKDVVIEDGVVQIGAYSFADCPLLERIEVPRSVSDISASFISTDSTCRIYCYYNSFTHTFVKENNFKYGFLDFNFLNNSSIDYDNRYMIVNTQLLNTLDDDIEIKKDSNIEFWVMPSFMTNGKQFFGTGSIVYIYSNSTPQENYTLVVSGDVNGDSVCDVLDCAQVALVTNGHQTLEGAYAEAADSNSDDIVDINDYQSIINKALAL